MKKVFGGLVIVVALVAVVSLLVNQDGGTGLVSTASAGYTEYSDAAFDQAQKDGKNVAVFFHSKSCGSCAALNNDIVKNSKNIPSDTAIFKADWDKDKNLAAQYDVPKYHTVTYIDGATYTNKNGLFTLADVMSELN